MVTKKDPPFFSVIMNCHNCASFLKEAIQSVYKQDFDDWEIIFFDNASTDSSTEIASSFDDRTKVFSNPDFLSLGQARNKAISKAKGNNIAFLDCDDIWLENKLSSQFDLIKGSTQKCDRFALCYSDAYRIDETGLSLPNYSFDHEMFDGRVFEKLLLDDFIPMSSCVINKEVFHEVGGFDTAFSYVEDWDLWLKVAMRHPINRYNSPLLKIRLHSDNASRNILAHAEEMHFLVKKFVSNGKISKAQNFAINLTKARLLFAKTVNDKANVIDFLTSLFKLTLFLLVAPRVLLLLTRKFLKPKMFKVLLKRLRG